MLEEIREKKNNRLAYALLAASGFGMLFIGLPTFTQQDNTAISVNGEAVSRDAYQNQRSSLQRQFPEADNQSLHQQTLEILSAQALLRQHAVESGYVLSDAALYEVIKGQFGDEQTYLDSLNRMRTNAKNYEAALRIDGGIERYYRALQSALNTPTVAQVTEQQLKRLMQSRLYHRYAINLDQLAQEVLVDDAALQKYYEENQARYISPETVELRFVRFAAADLAVEGVTDEQELKKQSALQGKRRAEYVIFNRIDPADQAKSALNAGTTDFATLRAQVKDKTIDGEEGEFALQAFGGTGLPVVDEALFALEKVGDVSEVLVTDYGRMLVKVTEIQEPSIEELQQTLRRDAQEKRYHEEGEQLVERALNGAGLEELAALAKLDVQMLDEVTAETQAPAWLLESAVQSALFGEKAVEVGKMLEPVSVDEGLSSVFVEVKARRLPEPLSFEQAKERVQRDYLADSAREAAQQKVVAVQSALAEGKTPEEIASVLGVTFEAVEWSRANVPQEVADLLFYQAGQKRFMEQEQNTAEGRVLAIYELKGLGGEALSPEAEALLQTLTAQVGQANQVAVMNRLQEQFVREQLKKAKIEVKIEESSETP